ncbi:MAG: trypsin-like peptidase domain-containing protein [Dehalococcoidia bacterium]|nr:trypsin-like peptidase domain-containing protein [Dehalococcoidia bacterium]MDD5493327.1 trypsin-like peptidase domain-containing protein [Dehalococcoidia bacterium]
MAKKNIYIFSISLAAIITMVLSSCTMPPNYDNIKKVFPAVVCIMVENRVGSGVIVSADGYVLTCQHLTGDDTVATVIMNKGAAYLGNVVAIDKTRDLAIIKLPQESSGFPFAALGDSSESDDLQTGSPIVILGYPGVSSTGNNLRLTTGILCSFSRMRGTSILKTSARTDPGSSGGPMVDSEGNVIGIVSSKYVNIEEGCINFAIASNEARDMLTELGGGKLPEKPPAEVTARPVCPNTGCRAPDFNLTTTGGQAVSLNSLKGKRAILLFVSAECPACIEMIRSVQKVYDYWPEKQLTVAVILSQVEIQDVESWIKQNDVKLSVAPDSTGDVTGLFKPDKIPAAYFLDKDGNIKVKRYDSLSSGDVDVLLRLF